MMPKICGVMENLQFAKEEYAFVRSAIAHGRKMLKITWNIDLN
jgi:hypothetical protein